MKALTVLILMSFAVVNARAEYRNDNEGMYDNYFREQEKLRQEYDARQREWDQNQKDQERQRQLDRIERNQNGGVGFKGGFGTLGNW